MGMYGKTSHKQKDAPRMNKPHVKKGDIDYASISAPANATRIKIEHTEKGGDVRYRL